MYLDPSQPSGLTTIENRNQIRYSSFYSAGLDQHHNQFKPNKDGKDANDDDCRQESVVRGVIDNYIYVIYKRQFKGAMLLNYVDREDNQQLK